ncbi:MAG TPA: (Fe-S)-binding protein [Paenibacillaceae bacterium]
MTNRLYEKAYEAANACVQCGYCLPACPTYASMGKESASPRGRIHLVKMAAEGKIDVLRDLKTPIDLCLGCRACEAVCPLNVRYGEILEAAREEIHRRQSERPAPGDRVMRMLLRHVFPHPGRLRRLGDLGRLLQVSGLLRVARSTRFNRMLPERLSWFAKALPDIPPPRERLRFGRVYPAKGERKARVALFAGCVMDAVMFRIHRATVSLLTAVGAEVAVPAGQCCCGALHLHQGMADEARELAKRNIEAFERCEADWIVSNAGGCGAAIKEYDRLFADDPEWFDRAHRLAEKSRDVSEILLELGPLPYVNGPETVVTYQDSCHLLNVQRVGRAPRALLEQAPGVRLKEMEGADRCCGSGGIYNLLHFSESMAILDEKMERVRETGAQVVISGNPGCILQLQIGIERAGASRHMRSVHLAEFLAERCGF